MTIPEVSEEDLKLSWESILTGKQQARLIAAVRSKLKELLEMKEQLKDLRMDYAAIKRGSQQGAIRFLVVTKGGTLSELLLTLPGSKGTLASPDLGVGDLITSYKLDLCEVQNVIDKLKA